MKSFSISPIWYIWNKKVIDCFFSDCIFRIVFLKRNIRKCKHTVMSSIRSTNFRLFYGLNFGSLMEFCFKLTFNIKFNSSYFKLLLFVQVSIGVFGGIDTIQPPTLATVNVQSLDTPKTTEKNDYIKY